jgi:DNA-binding NarL/FixJ family response regulator
VDTDDSGVTIEVEMLDGEGGVRPTRLKMPPRVLPVASRLSRRSAPRQRDVLARVALGETNREIGTALGIAEGTVKRHVSDLLQATGLKNRRQLMRFYDNHESAGSASSGSGPDVAV